MPRVAVPTMGIWSSGDIYLSESQMMGSAQFMDAPWRYERVEGATHWLMLDRPEAINELLLDFFDQNNFLICNFDSCIKHSPGHNVDEFSRNNKISTHKKRLTFHVEQMCDFANVPRGTLAAHIYQKHTYVRWRNTAYSCCLTNAFWLYFG